MTSEPIHPGPPLERYTVVAPDRYLVAGQPNQPPSAASVEEDALDALLVSRREGLEALAAEVGRLVAARHMASAEILGAIDRDHSYLENLVLDRYRLNSRPTDDPVYVKLRLEQLKLESERRREQSGCWRDTVLLAKELSELARRAEEARHREDLLGGPEP